MSVNSGDKGGLQNSVHKDSGVFVWQIYLLQNIFSYLMVKSPSNLWGTKYHLVQSKVDNKEIFLAETVHPNSHLVPQFSV